MADHVLEMPVPLRPNFTARLLIPRDITRAEVERLCGVLRTIPADGKCGAACGPKIPRVGVYGICQLPPGHDGEHDSSLQSRRSAP